MQNTLWQRVPIPKLATSTVPIGLDLSPMVPPLEELMLYHSKAEYSDSWTQYPLKVSCIVLAGYLVLCLFQPQNLPCLAL